MSPAVAFRRFCAVLALAALWLAAGPAGAADCPAPGTWVDPGSGAVLETAAVLADLSGRDVVLLGESHDSAEDHRWQATMLAALYGRHPDVAVGFEMFPRSTQPVLDRWAAGELSADELLEQSDWDRVWGFDADLYLPLFHMVRQQRLPMVALNVERALISRVGDEGWAAVPVEDREGVSDPAPAGEDYRHALAEVYRHLHGARGEAPAGLEETLESDDFQRFVEAQLTWDRAMAEALAAARRAHPGALVVGIVGRGHAEHGRGIPHQLADLGEDNVGVALPVPAGSLCGDAEPDTSKPGRADAAFVVDQEPERGAAPPGPRLGVRIGPGDGGVAVSEVVAGSVAEAAGLAVGDLVVEAAGVELAETGDLVEIVQRQAPGTWLPLRVERDGESLEIVARFPTRFGEPE